MIKIIEKVERYTILVTVFLYPLIVVSFFTNLFETSKLLLLVISVSLLTILKCIKIFIKPNFEINYGRYDILVFAFALTTLLSGLIASPNKTEAFFLPGAASFIILSSILYFFINQIEEKYKNELIIAVSASVFIMSAIQILALTGITSLVKFLPEIVKQKNFTPFGNTLSSMIIPVSLLPILVFRLISKKSDTAEKVLSGLVSTLLLVSIVATGANIFKKNATEKLVILDIKTGWSIAADSLKDNYLFGVGPSNFNYAFNKFRPVEFNSKEDWNLKYIQSTSSLLTVFTEIGLIAVLLLIALGILIIKNFDTKEATNYSLAIVFVAFALLPLPATIFTVLLILLAIVNNPTSHKLGNFTNVLPKVLILIPIGMFLITSIYLFTRAFSAEFLYSKAVKLLNEQKVSPAYETINKAVAANPYSDKYHLFSSGINITLAEVIAKKENLTEQDKNDISTLIQNSIREGKAAVAVNTKKSSNWLALSDIYIKIISFAKGADFFALESLKQAIILDPINPNLRIKMGSLFYTSKNYTSAIDSFKLATLAKYNLANAHYNLALAYKENKQLDKAKEEINITLNLLGKESADYEKAMKELQNIDDLTKPESKPEPVIEPQIELPQEATGEPQI